jgi:hypothetical protein
MDGGHEVAKSYNDVAGPNVPPLQRARREQLLAWLRDDVAPMTVAEIVDCADAVYGPRDDLVARKDLNELERYGLVRTAGHPKKWSAT